jgi:hypothetical protein
MDDILTQIQNDIAFRLRLQAKVSNLYKIERPHTVRIPTIYEEAADEIERLRIIIDNMAERNQKQNAEQLRIVRDIEANRDKWRDMATGSTNE